MGLSLKSIRGPLFSLLSFYASIPAAAAGRRAKQGGFPLLLAFSTKSRGRSGVGSKRVQQGRRETARCDNSKKNRQKRKRKGAEVEGAKRRAREPVRHSVHAIASGEMPVSSMTNKSHFKTPFRCSSAHARFVNLECFCWWDSFAIWKYDSAIRSTKSENQHRVMLSVATPESGREHPSDQWQLV